jgi:maleylacetoacetate isomerase
MMKLFDYYRSSASYRVRIALQYKKIDCDYEHIHLIENEGEQFTEDYCQKNSQQLVPILQVGQQYINQSLAILEYLEGEFPQRPLLPKNPLKAAKVRAFVLELACEVHPLNNLRVLKFLKNDLSLKEPQKIQWYHHWLDLGFTSLTQKMSQGPFCFGEKPSWADLFLIPQVYNAKRFEFDMARFPQLEAIYNHCMQQEYFSMASPEERLKAVNSL